MDRRLYTINLGGLPFTLTMNGLIGWGFLGIVLFLIMILVKDIAIGSAIVGALIGILLHFLVCLVHQAGHAFGANKTGHPMSGWASFWIIGQSLYPKDEPELPAETHIWRALGGQYFSLPLFIISLLVGRAILPDHGVAGVLAVFFMIDSFAFSFGALIPTPIIETDGNTLMHWMPKRAKK